MGPMGPRPSKNSKIFFSFSSVNSMRFCSFVTYKYDLVLREQTMWAGHNVSDLLWNLLNNK